MEEKERYIIGIGKGEDIFIADNDRKVMFTITTKKLQDLLNQQDKHIKKLQEEIKKANINNYLADYWLVEKENQQLKQQLAEKDKEIVRLNKFLQAMKIREHNQDKISFAVEQLEKVKNYMITDEKDMFGTNYLMNSGYVLEFIDDQIKELKGRS